MYLINDEKSAIKEIQKFLYVISQREKTIPHIAVDGYYGDETRIAVTEFQRLNFIEENGKVNKETYDLLYILYLDVLNEKNSSDTGLNSERFPLKMGDSGNDVAILNSILRELRQYYRELPITYGDFYSPDTENSVKEMQKHLRQEANGIVSESFLAILKKEIGNREKSKTNK